jgi:hypothetical protein
MRYFFCNAPGTIGYSVTMSSGIIMAIYAHKRDEDVQFYQDVSVGNPSLLWMYMPVEQGEYVTEIYGRYIRQWVGPRVMGPPIIGLMVRILSLFIYFGLTASVCY